MEATIAKENTNAPVREEDGPRINEEIRVKEVRLIDENGMLTAELKQAMLVPHHANIVLHIVLVSFPYVQLINQFRNH